MWLKTSLIFAQFDLIYLNSYVLENRYDKNKIEVKIKQQHNEVPAFKKMLNDFFFCFLHHIEAHTNQLRFQTSFLIEAAHRNGIHTTSTKQYLYFF